MKEMEPQVELEPCPFCGADEQPDGKLGPSFTCSTLGDPKRTFYKCQSCGARGPEISFEVAMQWPAPRVGNEASREAWNTRLAHSQPLPETGEVQPLPCDELLAERDRFIVSKGLWSEFVEQLPAALSSQPQVEEERAEERALALMIELQQIAGNKPATFTLESIGPVGAVMQQQHAAIARALASSISADGMREAYEQGFKDGFVEAHVDERGPPDEKQVLGRLDHVAMAEGWDANRDVLLAHPVTGAGQGELREALRDIGAERERQISAEGWTAVHDDQHSDGELVHAAVCYAMGERLIIARDEHGRALGGANIWPWHVDWWKPSSRRRNLVKSGALIVAEIERIDRATAAEPTRQPKAGKA